MKKIVKEYLFETKQNYPTQMIEEIEIEYSSSAIKKV